MTFPSQNQRLHIAVRNAQIRSVAAQAKAWDRSAGTVIGTVLSAADHPRSGTQTRSRTWPRPDPEMMTARYWAEPCRRSREFRTEILFLGPGGAVEPSKMND